MHAAWHYVKAHPLPVVLAVAGVGLLAAFGLPRLMEKNYYAFSDDDVVQLTIPKKALPEGTGRADIKVVKAAEGAAALAIPGGVVYKLEPAGLKLSDPVVVNVKTSTDKALVPLVYHVTEEKLDFLNETEVTVDQQQGTVTVEGKIDHFSSVVVGGGFFEARVSDPSDHMVGEQFSTAMEVKNVAVEQIVTNSEGKKMTIKLRSPVDFGPGTIYDRSLIEGGTEVLEPHDYNDVPKDGYPIARFGAYRAQRSWRCARPGRAVLHFRGFMSYGEEYDLGDPTWLKWLLWLEDKQARRMIKVSVLSKQFACRAGATDTVTPPTPTPTTKWEEMPEPTAGDETVQLEATVEAGAATVRGKWSPGYGSSSDPSKYKVQLVTLDGHEYPLMQFRVDGAHGGCAAPHYHAVTASQAVYTLDKAEKPDPEPAGCGFGMEGELAIVKKLLDMKTIDAFRTWVEGQ